MHKATPNIGILHEIREKRPSAVHPPNLAILLPHAPQRAQHRRSKARQQQQQQEPQSKREPTKPNQTKPTSAKLDSKIETRNPKANPPPTSKMPTRKGEPTGEHKRSFPNAKRKITTRVLFWTKGFELYETHVISFGLHEFIGGTGGILTHRKIPR